MNVPQSKDFKVLELRYSSEYVFLHFPIMSTIGPSLDSIEFIDGNLFEHPSAMTNLITVILQN